MTFYVHFYADGGRVLPGRMVVQARDLNEAIEAAQREFENDFLMASPVKGDAASQQFLYSPDKLLGFTVVEATTLGGEGLVYDGRDPHL